MIKMVNENNDSYWKRKFEESERELEEFRESSSMLERELEGSLEQHERSNKLLKIENNKLQLERDLLKDKLSELQLSAESRICELEEERAQWHKREEDYVKYIRELEQKNDDLERSQRAMLTSLGEIESKLNFALEKNVLLESELDEKESLQIMVQRLKDEARDLKQEINIREKHTIEGRKSSVSFIDSNKLCSNGGNSGIGGGIIGGLDSTPTTGYGSTSPITSPSRISAMNIVGDLLRKVGALESKLAHCQRSPQAMNDSLSSNDSVFTPPSMNYRSRKLNRGTSTPSIHSLIKS